MPQPLSDIIRRVRSKLNEPAYPTLPGSTPSNTPHFYTDTEITDWVNDCSRDIARRTEDLQQLTNLTAVVGLDRYILPTDFLRVHRVDFQPFASLQVYPVDIKTREEADQYVGFNPNIQSSYPYVCWLWGTPNSSVSPCQLFFYPVFSTAGNIMLWYYRVAQRIADPVANPSNYSVTVDVPEGWDDAVVLFAEAMALQKARSSVWQERMQQYEGLIGFLVDTSRHWHDQTQQISLLSDQYSRWVGRGDVW